MRLMVSVQAVKGHIGTQLIVGTTHTSLIQLKQKDSVYLWLAITVS